MPGHLDRDVKVLDYVDRNSTRAARSLTKQAAAKLVPGATVIGATAFIAYEGYEIYKGKQSLEQAGRNTAKIAIPYAGDIMQACEATRVEDRVCAVSRVGSKMTGAMVGGAIGTAFCPGFGTFVGAQVGKGVGEYASDLMTKNLPDQYFETIWNSYMGEPKITALEEVSKNFWDNDYTYLERMRDAYIGYEQTMTDALKRLELMDISDMGLGLEDLEQLESFILAKEKELRNARGSMCMNIRDIVGGFDAEHNPIHIQNSQRYEGYRSSFNQVTGALRNDFFTKSASLKTEIAARKEALMSQANQERVRPTR